MRLGYRETGAGVFNISTKRLIDVLLSSLALVLLSPLMLVVYLCIKAESKGAPIFRQTRVGLNGNVFTMYKFRSMRQCAESVREQLLTKNEMTGGVLFKIKQDPRITRIGRIIRKTSIDELPQLLNVVKGDMSLVGPRPPLEQEVAEYDKHDYQRLSVKPGITCLWQVSGRSDIPFKQQVQMDMQYIQQQSFLFDLELLLKTVPAVISARGAY
jgi:exopolysaccharide biosynthesis polyprenyl glycosylphosphotransferase